jgi:uncharacterized RDD family membrane protein YckC
VVAGHDHELTVPERLAERAHHRGGRGQDLGQRPVAKLEHVAEQHQAVDVVESLDEAIAVRLAPDQVRAVAEPEVEVGDDRRPHRAIVSPAAARPVPTAVGGTIRAMPSADPERPERRPQLPARLLGIGARGAERVASATGIDEAVERTTEEALVRALESPAFERAIIRVLESEAAQRAFERTLASPAVEQAAVKVLDSQLIDHVWDRLLASEEAQKLVERIAEAPEVRAAIASQGVGLLDDIGRQVRDIAGRLDDALEATVRRLVGRPRVEPTANVGAVTRLLAFAIDGAILNGGFLLAAAVLADLFGSDGISGTGWAFGAFAWLLGGSAYLLTFWSLAGQTPGMRVLSIRIEADGSRRLGRRRARRRLVGFILSAIPLGLGFIGVITHDDRRGFHDRHAGTEVVRVDPAPAPFSTPQ